MIGGEEEGELINVQPRLPTKQQIKEAADGTDLKNLGDSPFCEAVIKLIRQNIPLLVMTDRNKQIREADEILKVKSIERLQRELKLSAKEAEKIYRHYQPINVK